MMNLHKTTLARFSFTQGVTIGETPLWSIGLISFDPERFNAQ